MGQIPNKTYTAPDGSVYRVENDGSITKIKDGRVQSTEPPSKYQITPDGKIYRVESDGSVTYLGNAEERQPTPPPPSCEAESQPKKPNSKKWIGWLIVIVIIAIAAIAGMIYNESNLSYDYKNDYNYSYTLPVEECVETIEEAPAEVAVEEAPAEECVETVEEVPAEVAYDNIGFHRYENREYRYYSKNEGYFRINFYDNGQCDIFDSSNMLDSGGYVIDGRVITFIYFDNWPNEPVYLDDDGSFRFNGLTFNRY